ncbi:MAG: polyphosphate:AMP phosphotransferase [Candidatus Omnitrophica bacterium]|nr:Polyphosphate:AMP phosphotransferase [bacterium]NUN96916.1 polyphosphate:AMP phosphotransferase [Candidatus Omnitrophota bacterium]
MLEQVDLTHALTKKEFEAEFPPLRNRLSELQQRIRQAGIPTIIVFEGWEASGKGAQISRLVERLDPRWVQTHLVEDPVPEELLRPFLWRFWIKTPAQGHIALFDQSWYRKVLVDRALKRTRGRELPQVFREIVQFERQLADSGAVLVKFFLHISEKEQRKRVSKITKDPTQAWQVTKADRRLVRNYGGYAECVEEMLQRCSPHFAPWTVVEAHCKRFATVKVFQTVIAALERALEEHKAQARRKPKPIPLVPHPKPTLLDRIDLSVQADRKEYDSELPKLQVRMRELEFSLFRSRVPLVVVYEGWDAAGKGGNIRRVTGNLDPRGYQVTSIAAPNQEELAHHFLWRFWRPLQKAGHISIFDRSWYGRVLVERVEGFCRPEDWWRAYQEINEFEEQLSSFGTIIVKFWIHLSAKEQLRRFKERQKIPHKRWKITEEDWRNRAKWPLYEEAALDMLERTSTTYAPWVILEGNCKLHARLKALRTLTERVEEALGR